MNENINEECTYQANRLVFLFIIPLYVIMFFILMGKLSASSKKSMNFIIYSYNRKE